MPSGPPQRVLTAFGVGGARPVLLDGGEGRSWLAGEMVFKPADLDEAELEWQARICPQVRCDGFRLGAPRAAIDGSLCVDGWHASDYVTGRHEPGRWAEIIAVGERFHAALAGTPRPHFLDQRSSPWAISDRVAWAEIPGSQFPLISYLPRLAAAVRPLTAPSQVIHGDLTGNVLFDDQQPPAIIDFSPYWRPVGYASAIVVADALVWQGASNEILDAVSHVDDFGQYLIRALIFRLVSDWLLTHEEPTASGTPDDRWAPAVDLAGQLAAPGNRALNNGGPAVEQLP